MARELNFQKLDRGVTGIAEERERRWASREPNATVQMSIRMKTDLYDRFRALCKEERRTNGDMLEVLLEDFFARAREAAKK